MDNRSFTAEQDQATRLAIEGSIFLEGPVGSGKSTTTIARIKHILTRYAGHQILLFVPQRSLAKPYFDHFYSQKDASGSLPSIITFGGFTRRMVELFWPLIAEQTAFSHPNSRPFFLSIESAQYVMERVTRPFIEKGFFQSVVIEKSRLFSQILDNLNKASVVRFPITEIAQRLKGINHLDASMEIAYEQVQICAQAFRNYCFQHNLMDFSLLIDLFIDNLSHSDFFSDYFHSKFPVVLAENIEEDTPIFHDFIRAHLPSIDSAWLVFDQNGGYRSFLGADPQSAYSLKDSCDQNLAFDRPLTKNQEIINLKNSLSRCLNHQKIQPSDGKFGNSLKFHDFHFYPEMVKSICLEVQALVESGAADPGEIVILSPYLSDALSFSFNAYFEQSGIPASDLRPSRKYLDNPAVRAVITMALLAHPAWGINLSHYELRNALLCCFKGMDIVRADLIAKTLFNSAKLGDGLRPFDTLTNLITQERITFVHGSKLDKLRTWLAEYKTENAVPLDIFISRLFGEVLSQADFGFFEDYDSANAIARLIVSIRNFRHFSAAFLDMDAITCGAEYIHSIRAGLLPAAFFDPREELPKAVLIAPAHSFLMQNRSVAYQFWLDIGSLGWWERLNQPLTNPYLLNRSWDANQKWTIAHEHAANQASMLKIVQGLISRCTRQIIACSVSMNEQGNEQRGQLLRAFQSFQKQVFKFNGENHV